MQLQLQDFATLVRTQAAAVGAATRQLVDLSVGSVLRAVLEANASIGLWLQWLIVEVLTTTRAQTSRGADLDSWVQDFGMARLPGVAAYGLVTFSRLTPGLPAVVPVGAMVRNAAGGLSFSVVADAGHAAWNGTGYGLDATSLQVELPVVARAVGSQGNLRAGEIGLLGSAVPGVDAVSNAAPLQGGLDAEADTALRERFGGFIDSRSRATAQAVGFALRSLQQGISFTIAERIDSGGSARAGHFTVTVDDGSGVPPASLLAAAGAAVDAVRPLGGTFSVRAPLIVRAEVALRIAGAGASLATVRAAVGAFVASRPIGGWLVVSRLVQVAHEADAGVESVYAVTINGVGADLQVPAHALVRPGQIVVTT